MTKVNRDELMHSNGTSPYETIIHIVPSFFVVFILTLLIRDVGSSVIRLLLEFCLIIIPLILIMTVFAEHATTIFLSLVLTSIGLCFILLKEKSGLIHKPKSHPNVNYGNKFRLPFITDCRSTINVLSIIAILAVDFRIFPRTFTKTLTYGYSLMDTGVGLYIFGNGMIASEIRAPDALSKTLKSVIPLIILGGMRSLLVKEIDYHVPVIEYGVHWNFFLTLAAVRIISFLVLKCISAKNSIFSAISLLIAHEIILQLGAAEYVLSDVPRNNFFSANREGIVSSLGYGALYFFSVSVGNLIISETTSRKLNPRLLFKLIGICIFFLWASLILEKNFGISRRLTNSAYCIWILHIATIMVSLFYAGEMIYDIIYNKEDFCKVPMIYESINYNPLVFFLLANVLTGIVNIMFDTLEIEAVWSLIIVITYMFINCAVLCLLHAYQIKLKL